MRKLMVSLVFVLGIVTMANAQTPEGCAEEAWAEADEVLASNPTLSEWDAWEITNTLYEDCMNEE